MSDSDNYSKFLEIRERQGYIYCHEVRTGGRTVAIVPHRLVGDEQEFLARVEICPAHSLELGLYSITGGVKRDEQPTQAAQRELLEETGYNIEVTDLVELGMVRPSKQMDTCVYLFTVNLTNTKQGKITGDGSFWEQDASAKWLSLQDSLQVIDPLFVTTIARIRG